jgi:FkbM family methyltransferase
MGSDSARRSLLEAARRLLPTSRRARLRRALFDWLQLTWTTAQGVHLRVANYNEWIIYNEIFVDGEYDAAIQTALRHRTGRPLHVVDLGANVGFFTLRLFDRTRAEGLADAECHVTLVEADPAIVPVLDRRVHGENALGAQVRVVPGAVGGPHGSLPFYPSVISPGEGSLIAAPHTAAVQVPSVDLDRVLADLPWIDLVKCDVEGAEMSVFEGSPAWLRKTATVVVEIHAARSRVESCRAGLASAGLTHETVLRDRGGCALCLYTRE